MTKTDKLTAFANSLLNHSLAYVPEKGPEMRFFRILSIDKVGVNKVDGREYITAHVQDLDDHRNKVRTLTVENIASTTL